MIDAHCHLNHYVDPKLIAEYSDELGVTTILSATLFASHFEHFYSDLFPLKNVLFALGLHPLNVRSHDRELPIFLRNIDKTAYIGEVGLDFSKKGIALKHIQIATFEKILEAVSGKNKLLSVHSKNAEKEVLELLKERKINAAIFHWYEGPLKLIDDIVDAGYYFSINPKMLKSKKGRKIIDRIPREYLLAETDGPYGTKDGRLIFPGDIIDIYLYFSKIYQLPLDTIQSDIQTNFQRLQSIK